MASLLNTLWRTVVLDDAAYEAWRERPNIFLRAIMLIVVISLVAGLVSFAVDLVNRVTPPRLADIEQGMQGWLEWNQYLPFYQDPEFQRQWRAMTDVLVPMIRDLSNVKAPLPVGITGFFNALGSWLSRALAAISGWLFYGALVLIAANLLGGTAKLTDFLGTVALYVIPGLLLLLQPVPCVGWLLALVGTIWSIVIYVKATSVATGLDGGKAFLAAILPFLAFVVLGVVLSALVMLWFAIIF
jgi:hypothetical protein